MTQRKQAFRWTESIGDDPRGASGNFENVVCRVSSTAGLAMHIDYDEANAACFQRMRLRKCAFRHRAAAWKRPPAKPHAEEKTEQKPAAKTGPEKEKIP